MNDRSATVLVAEDLSKRYTTRAGELHVLRGVSLTCAAGASAAIMGPSGSGKSTLLNILGTLDQPTAGTVRIGGEDPFALDERRLALFRNKRVGFVFQEHHLLPQCSVVENVLLPTLASAREEGAVERARELIERVGLTQRLDHRPGELSGGERQRVAVARALINQPTLLLADEPTGNLDRQTADSVADLLIEIGRSEQVALLVVTHSDSLAKRLDCRWTLHDGQLQLDGEN